ncbi:hemolysin family protein [Gilvimarinus sp. F26214L]|uniref:hemolysin family protein n=1 Tax=Gilvimarinus sp. DZF01 TaxID=3461371 RepID=UPI0040466E34
MELLVLSALILLNGVFALSELALVTANSNRLQRLADDGDSSAKRALRLQDEPTQFLSTIQIGITAIGILNGIVGEAAMAGPLSTWLQGLGLDPQYSHPTATFVVVVTVTYFTIVIGELVPKRLAQNNAEGLARLVAAPVALLARVSRPFVALLSASTDGILRLLGKSELSSSNLTEEDIHAVLAQGSASGVIEKHEHEMVRKVFRLDERVVASLMTPRSDIVYLNTEESLQSNLERVASSNHSRFPVCEGTVSKILGVATTKHLLKQTLEAGGNELTEELQPAVFVPESVTGMQVLAQFRDSGVQIAFVIDEYGELQGLVTIQDILEAITGEFGVPGEEDAWAVQREDGSWLLDGLTPIPELKDHLELKTVPDEKKGRYHTLSGMMMCLIDRLPRTGDIVNWEDWRFEIVDLDGNRVDKVLASRLPEPAPPSDQSA